MRTGLHDCRRKAVIAMVVTTLLFLSCLFSPLCFARPVTSRQVQTYLPSDGLSGDYVRSIVRTEDGVIWFACWNTGITRYDGYTWRNFGRTDGLPSNDVRMLFLDRDKRLWCATTEGIAWLDGEEWRSFETPLPNLARPSVYRICQRQNGAIWFSLVDNQILQFLPQSANPKETPSKALGLPEGEWSIAKAPQGPGRRYYNALLSTKEDEVWFAISMLGVFAWRNNRWETVSDAQEEKSYEFNSLVQIQDGSIWCANEHYVIRYANGDRSVWAYPDELVTCLEPVPQGGILIGTEKRIQYYDGKTFQDLQLDDKIPPSLVRKITFIDDNTFWVGSRYGAYRVSGNIWTPSNPPPAEKPLSVATIHADRQHPAITHDADGNLYQWDGHAWAMLVPVDHQDGPCRDFTRECDGRIWVLFRHSAVEVSVDERKTLRTISLPDMGGGPSIYWASSKRLFIYCRKNIYEYVNGNWVLFRINVTNDIRTMFEDASGAIWVRWTDRLERCTGNTWQDMIKGDDANLYQLLETITETYDHQILMGIAGNGIYTLQQDRLVMLFSFEGAQSKQSFSIFKDHEGTIWVGNRQTGISSYRDGRWIAYRGEQGVPDGRIHAIVEDPQGVIWASVEDNGLYRFTPQPGPPKTTISHSPTTTAYADRAVFQCTAVDKWNITRAEDIQFSWRILLPDSKGIVQDWTPFSSDSFIIAPRLSADHYILEARTQDMDRNIDPSPARTIFTIQRPFWLLPIFYLPLSSLLIAVIALSIAWIRKHVLLAESERKHRDILNTITEIVYAHSPEGVFTYVSPSIETILGFSPEDIVGTSVKQYMTDKDFQHLSGQIETLSQVKNIKAEYPFFTFNNEIRWLRLSFQGITNREALVDVKGIATGITERRLAEDKLKATLDDLEVLVEERTREVYRVNKSLKAEIEERKRFEEEQHRLEEQLAQAHRMESIGRLAGGIAHDFNNVLAVILGHGDLLLADLDEETEMYESLSEIIGAAERAKELTRQLLAFSRKQVLEVRNIDPNAILVSMEKMLRRLLGEDIVITVKTGNHVGQINADPSQLEQVILNLCVNARDAMPNGGTLTLETDQIYLDEKHIGMHGNLAPGSYVILTVTDTGCGMDTETRQHIFEPFFTTKDKGKGTGLGLSTVYGIVQQHGGMIWVISEPNQGATFRVYLPQARETSTKEHYDPIEHIIKGNGETILVVEDDEGVRRLTCQMLTRLGYSVVEARDADDCFEQAARMPHIHLLLTDVIMPGMNGRQVAEHMSRLRPDIKVAFMSGYTEDIIGHHGMLEENIHFISKPFTEAALSMRVHAALQQ